MRRFRGPFPKPRPAMDLPTKASLDDRLQNLPYRYPSMRKESAKRFYGKGGEMYGLFTSTGPEVGPGPALTNSLPAHRYAAMRGNSAKRFGGTGGEDLGLFNSTGDLGPGAYTLPDSWGALRHQSAPQLRLVRPERGGNTGKPVAAPSYAHDPGDWLVLKHREGGLRASSIKADERIWQRRGDGRPRGVTFGPKRPALTAEELAQRRQKAKEYAEAAAARDPKAQLARMGYKAGAPRKADTTSMFPMYVSDINEVIEVMKGKAAQAVKDATPADFEPAAPEEPESEVAPGAATEAAAPLEIRRHKEYTALKFPTLGARLIVKRWQKGFYNPLDGTKIGFYEHAIKDRPERPIKRSQSSPGPVAAAPAAPSDPTLMVQGIT